MAKGHDRGIKVAVLVALLAAGPALAQPPARERKPEAIVNDTCILCHGPGIGGAPRLGDTKAWSKRTGRGLEALVRSAAEGRGAMPPRGGVPDLTEGELRAVVAYVSGLQR